MKSHGITRMLFRWLIVAAALLPLVACGKLKHNGPAITSASSATFIIGQAGSFTVTATGYPAPTFKLDAAPGGTPPSWLTLDSKTGVLSGTPPADSAGTYPLVITATNGTSPDASQNFTLTVTAASTAILIVHDGTPETAGILTNLSNIVIGISGYSVQASSGVPTTSLSGYKEIWDIRYNNTVLSSTDITSYTTYVQGGGMLVLLGGSPTGFTNRNGSVKSLIATLGGGSINVTQSVSTTQTVLTPFNNNVTSVKYSNPGELMAGSLGSGQWVTVVGGTAGTAIFFDKNKLNQATAGRLIAIFDFGFLQTNVTTDVQNFVKNIIVLP